MTRRVRKLRWHTFSAHNPKCSRRFREMLKFWTRSVSSCRPVNEGCCLCFFAGNFGFLKAQNMPNRINDQISGESTRHKRSRRFWEISADFFNTCSVSPCRPVNERYYLFIFAGNFRFLKAQISVNDQITGENQKPPKKTPFVNGLTGAHRSRAQFSGFVS